MVVEPSFGPIGGIIAGLFAASSVPAESPVIFQESAYDSNQGHPYSWEVQTLSPGS